MRLKKLFTEICLITFSRLGVLARYTLWYCIISFCIVLRPVLISVLIALYRSSAFVRIFNKELIFLHFIKGQFSTAIYIKQPKYFYSIVSRWQWLLHFVY